MPVTSDQQGIWNNLPDSRTPEDTPYYFQQRIWRKVCYPAAILNTIIWRCDRQIIAMMYGKTITFVVSTAIGKFSRYCPEFAIATSSSLKIL